MLNRTTSYALTCLYSMVWSVVGVVILIGIVSDPAPEPAAAEVEIIEDPEACADSFRDDPLSSLDRSQGWRTEWVTVVHTGEETIDGFVKNLSNTGPGWARVLPYERNGTIVGLKLYGVRSLGPLGHVGLRNGDTISSINGIPVGAQSNRDWGYLLSPSPQRSKKFLDIELIRHGRPGRLVVFVESPPSARSTPPTPSI